MVKKLFWGAIMSVLPLFAAEIPDGPMLKIVDTAHKMAPQDNILLSPYSIQQCFGMVRLGAGKRTAEEIDDILGINEALLKKLKAADKSLKESKKAKFSSCNTIVFNRKFVLQKTFENSAADLFDGKFFKADFSQKKECADLLNKLVAEQSCNMFDKVFTERDFANDPDMVLMNVLYFKALWQNRFESYMTRNRKFTCVNGNILTVKMLCDERYIPYFSGNGIHGIILDYQDARFGMMFLMPQDPAVPVSKVTELLAENGVDHFIKKSSEQYKTILSLPKLKLETDCDLAKLFKKAGIKHLFDPQTGDLIYIVENTNDPLYIDSARQLVKLDLNEAGTEMAAVTYAMAKCGSAPPRPEKKNIFRAERPYVMVLFDRTTNAVLLAGVINNPLKAKN